MPYTPPTQQSPSTSRPESPKLSRSQSYIKQHVAPTFTTTPRPVLPRSASSTSYLHKHRRSPSVTRSTFLGPTPSTPDASPDNAESFTPQQGYVDSSKSSSQQSSPRPDNMPIPRGTVVSPPDSAPSSSDEEGNPRDGRARELENLAELQAAIRVLEQHRESSPNRTNEESKKARIALGLIMPDAKSSAIEQVASTRPPLSPEARRISHSRSATESSAYLDLSQAKFASPSRSASDSDQDDSDVPLTKPPMLRKKSGELVRPAIRPTYARRRPSSMPGTPTYSKAVHFDSNLEHVRHFLQVDRPLAVSAGSSPVEAYESDMEFPFTADARASTAPFEWKIRLTNFPQESPQRNAMPVRVEKVFLSSDNKNLIGSVVVQNLAFHKLVVARFTLDYWKTTSEVVAEYSNDVRRKQLDDGFDRFSFSIKLADQANLESKTMFLCVRYSVNGQEFWDSNGNINYQIDFTKQPVPQNGEQGMQGNGTRPLNALPRSRPSPPNSAGRPRPKTTSFEEFGSGRDSQYDFGSFPQPATMTFADTPLRFKNPKAAGNVTADAPVRRANAPAQAFGNRYDFGASLSAAIQAANTTPGDKGSGQVRDEGSFPAPKSAKQPSFVARPLLDASSEKTEQSERMPGKNKEAFDSNKATAENPKPAALTSEKPPIQSQSYHDLLNKYCFVRSKGPKEGEQSVR